MGVQRRIEVDGEWGRRGRCEATRSGLCRRKVSTPVAAPVAASNTPFVMSTLNSVVSAHVDTQAKEEDVPAATNSSRHTSRPRSHEYEFWWPRSLRMGLGVKNRRS